jgi:hypothetical protein
MTSHPSARPVSALRARMIEDMRVRGFSEKTRNERHGAAFLTMRQLDDARQVSVARWAA